MDPGESRLQAFSKAGTIFPGPNQPRSPPRDFEGQVECSRARASKLAPCFTFLSSSSASFLSLTSMWLARHSMGTTIGHLRGACHHGTIISMVTKILRPATVQEALKARALPGSAYLGGGTWLNASASPQPITLISLERLGLQSIEAEGTRCAMGALVNLQQIVDHPGLPQALQRAAALTGSRTLRNMITIGGEVALHPADSALIPLLLAMGAEISIAGKKRPIALKDFLSSPEGGLILSVTISEPHRLATLLAVSRTSHSPRSLVVSACAAALEPEVSKLRLVAADCRGTPVRLSRLEASLEGRPLPPRSELEESAGDQYSPAPDILASSGYKAYMTRVLVTDALLQMKVGEIGL